MREKKMFIAQQKCSVDKLGVIDLRSFSSTLETIKDKAAV